MRPCGEATCGCGPVALEEVAPVTVTIIWRDDPLLYDAIRSVRPYVREVVVVCTGDDLPARPVVDMIDRLLSAWGCLDKYGRIADFAAARNIALKSATQPWVMWIDSDDVLTDAHELADAVRKLRPGQRAMFPYWYAVGDDGTPTVVQYRERIVPNDGTYHWIHPVHETLVRVDGGKPDDVVFDTPVWKHRRKHEPVPTDDRNLRILRANEAVGDPWWELNMGHELYRHGNYIGAAAHYECYVRSSGWAVERAYARCRMADVYTALGLAAGDFDIAQTCAIEAVKDDERFETWFALGKVRFLMAMHAGSSSMLEPCAEALSAALRCENEWTPLAVQPGDRLHALEMLRQVRETQKDWTGALTAARDALAVQPRDAQLLMAASRYEAAIALDEAEKRAAHRLSVPAQVTTAKPTGLDIVFACGNAPKPWNPAIHAQHGAGGSETACIHMAKRLAARGHRVRVYGTPGTPGEYDGVAYLPYEPDKPPTSDVSIVWRFAPLLEWGAARVRMLWCHDIHPIGWHPRYAPQSDRVLGLSRWHCDRMVKDLKLPWSQVYLTRNGVDTSLFTNPEGRACNRCIYSSSPDRGLPVLLDMWPRIRDAVPDATLDVFYDWSLWRDSIAAKGDEMLRYLAETLECRCRTLPGVTLRGGVDQATLAREMCESGVWLYPTWWSETSCIGAMEAQAAGMRVVTSRIAALEETAAGEWLIDGDWLSSEYQDRFVQAAVQALAYRDPNGRASISDAAKRNLGWDGVVDDWEYMIEDVLRDVDRGVLPEYGVVT